MEVRIETRNGQPRIVIGGEAYEPLAFRSFRPDERNVSDFAAAGVRLMALLSTGLDCTLRVPYSLFGETWIGPGTYDWEPLDRQIALFRRCAPNAYLNVMLELDTRPWWLASHPQGSNSYWNLVEVAGDPEWRAAAAAYLRAAIEHVEATAGDRVFAYSLFGGCSTEWYTNSQTEAPEGQVRFHPLKREAFRRWTGDPDAELPGAEALARTSHGVLRDPCADAEALRYWRFHNDIIAEAIGDFARTAKDAMQRRKLVGLFYGYLIALTGRRLLEEGHMGYERVYRCPDIDLLYAPAAYGSARDFNGSSAFLSTVDSPPLHGKLYIHEIDHRTHLAGASIDGRVRLPGWERRLPDAWSTRMVLRREFVMSRLHRGGLWWFDFFGGYYADDTLMDEIREAIRVNSRLAEVDMAANAEIAVFGDVESMYYLDQTAQVNDDTLRAMQDALNWTGAPYDLFTFSDLDDTSVDLDRYRLFIFLNTFKVGDPRLAIVHRAIRRPGRHALWLYAPGYITDDGFSEARMAAVTGMVLRRAASTASDIHVAGGGERYAFRNEKVSPLFAVTDPEAETLGMYPNGETALARKRGAGNWVSWFSGAGRLPVALLRRIAAAAGVHLYSEGPDAVYVNSRCIGVHARGGRVELRIPGPARTAEELFDGGQFPVRNGRLEADVPPGVTRLYLFDAPLRPDAP